MREGITCVMRFRLVSGKGNPVLEKAKNAVACIHRVSTMKRIVFPLCLHNNAYPGTAFYEKSYNMKVTVSFVKFLSGNAKLKKCIVAVLLLYK